LHQRVGKSVCRSETGEWGTCRRRGKLSRTPQNKFEAGGSKGSMGTAQISLEKAFLRLERGDMGL
jgi:hypothetical protein